MATVTNEPTVEDIRREAKERGIEFFFAQFVDMYARPSAKLVPAANLDDLVTDGAGFAGFAAGGASWLFDAEGPGFACAVAFDDAAP